MEQHKCPKLDAVNDRFGDIEIIKDNRNGNGYWYIPAEDPCYDVPHIHFCPYCGQELAKEVKQEHR